MQLRRLAIGGIALGLAASVAPAHAVPRRAPQKVCMQITDEQGDGHPDVASALTSPTLDVLSADISTGPTEVSGIIRVKSLAVDNDPVAKFGERWNLVFTVQGVKYVFYAHYTPTAANPWDGGMTVNGTSQKSDPAAKFWRDGNNLMWSVSRTAIDALRKPKMYLYINNANSGWFSFGADAADPKPNTKYLDKTPSCLSSK